MKISFSVWAITGHPREGSVNACYINHPISRQIPPEKNITIINE